MEVYLYIFLFFENSRNKIYRTQISKQGLQQFLKSATKKREMSIVYKQLKSAINHRASDIVILIICYKVNSEKIAQLFISINVNKDFKLQTAIQCITLNLK